MKKLALTALAFLAPLAPAHAAYSVDTGTPTGAIFYSLLNGGSSNFQQLAGQVTFAAVTKVATIEGYIFAPSAADVQISLFTNTISFGNLLLQQSFAASAGEGWKGISFTGFDLPAGTYWVTFRTFVATPILGMRNGAPSPLANYAFINQTSAGAWAERPNLAFGVRIGDGVTAAVPEPASWALMIGGMALAGAMLRRRTATRIQFA